MESGDNEFTVKWIKANTKPCPNKKCLKPIEKNQGCNHMKCAQCKTDFCWLCLKTWAEGCICNKLRGNNAEKEKQGLDQAMKNMKDA